MKEQSAISIARSSKKNLQNRLKFAHFPFLQKMIMSEHGLASEPLRVLDIGCGPGNLALYCGDQSGCKLFGIDLWPNQLLQAADKDLYEGLSQVNMVDGLPFADESFDIIVCNEVLMYLPNVREALMEFHRVLVPEGKLFVYNPISLVPRLFYNLKKIMRCIYQDKTSIAFNVESNWKRAERACRINYYSFYSLIEQIRSVNFQVSEIAGFRLFRNRIRLMRILENYTWYRKLVRFVTARHPRLASDILIMSQKKMAHTLPLSLDKAAA